MKVRNDIISAIEYCKLTPTELANILVDISKSIAGLEVETEKKD